MPREIVNRVTVFKFDELTEAAQEKAVEAIRERLSGPWWDTSDDDDISETIVFAFADELGTPGREQYGEADYPGIPGVTLDGWDMDRGQSVVFKGVLTPDFKGVLTPENAPKLPWADGAIAQVDLTAKRDHTYLYVEPEWDEDSERQVATEDQLKAMDQAVRDAMHEAWKTGRDEMDYKGGDDRAREWIELNEPEFTEDGNLYA